jgi:hypothetical protein
MKVSARHDGKSELSHGSLHLLVAKTYKITCIACVSTLVAALSVFDLFHCLICFDLFHISPELEIM